jgi:protein-tyrosine-phosphatase
LLEGQKRSFQLATSDARSPENRVARHPPSILFVCGGNTCRSPMAVGLTRQLFGLRVKAESAGIDAAVGAHAAINAVRAMKEIGIDISAHRSRDLSSVALSHYDYVVAMDPGVAKMIEEMGVTHGINLIVWKVADPYGGDIEEYRKTAGTIKSLLLAFRKSLVCGTGRVDPPKMDGLR